MSRNTSALGTTTLVVLLMCGLAYLLVLMAPVAQAQSSVVINVITKDGNTAYALEKHVDDFKQATGITVNVIPVPFDRLYTEIVSDLQSGSSQYDGFLFAPAWVTDFVTCDSCPGENPLEPLGTRIRSDPEIEWTDVATFFRSFSSSYNSEIYAIPLDGDIHFMYHRTDVLTDNGLTAPRTWEEYLEVSAALAALPSQDWNGDGVDDYVSCIPKKVGDLGYWFVYDVAGAYIQSQGTKAGAFFDIDTMEPLVDNAGFRRALELYRQTNDFGPPDELDLGVGDTRTLMLEGRCVFALDWGDIPILANETPYRDVIGTSIMPGSTEVLSEDRLSLVPCDAETCPHAVSYTNDDGSTLLVNHAPYAAFGGWSGAVAGQNSDPARIQAAYDFFSFVSAPAQSNQDVIDGDTGFQMYRFSQVDRNLWLDAGFHEDAIDPLIEALQATLSSANLMLDMRIPGAADYQGGSLDGAVWKCLNGDYTIDVAVREIVEQWNIVSNERGRREQLQIYRATIGQPPKDFGEEEKVSLGARIAISVIAGLLILCCLVTLVFVAVNRKLKVWHYASPTFLCGTLIGAISVYVGLILYSADATAGTCATSLWLTVLGVATLLGGIFAMSFRTWRLFSNKNMQVRRLRDIDIMPIALVVVALAAVILIVWTAMDHPRGVRSTEGVDAPDYVVICDSPDYNLPFFITLVCYFGVLLLVALILSFNTRNAGEAFNESKTLGLCVYNLTQVLIIVIVAAVALDNPTGRYILVVLAIGFGVTMTWALLFLPKMYKTVRGRGDDVALSKFGSGTQRRTTQQRNKANVRSGAGDGDCTSTSSGPTVRDQLQTIQDTVFGDVSSTA